MGDTLCLLISVQYSLQWLTSLLILIDVLGIITDRRVCMWFISVDDVFGGGAACRIWARANAHLIGDCHLPRQAGTLLNSINCRTTRGLLDVTRVAGRPSVSSFLSAAWAPGVSSLPPGKHSDSHRAKWGSKLWQGVVKRNRPLITELIALTNFACNVCLQSLTASFPLSLLPPMLKINIY